MSSIKNITSSNPVPIDLAERLGADGIGVILSTMWLGYHDLRKDNIIQTTTDEDSITVEWYTKIYDRWVSESRAAKICLKLIPINQYPDHTCKRAHGRAPTIDFCFRSWDKNDGYFGAECKRLIAGQKKLILEYVENGVKRFSTGKYSSKCSVSAMVGYVQGGSISDIVEELKPIIAGANTEENLVRVMAESNPEYKSKHLRSLDTTIITLYHLFFDFSTVSQPTTA